MSSSNESFITDACEALRRNGDYSGGAELRQSIELDFDLLRERKIFVSGSDEDAMIAISAFKSLRTHMLREMEQRGVNSLVITGTTKDVGKSVTAANLAINIARHKDMNVLLVDLDLRAPSVANLFGFTPYLGIDDVMSDRFVFHQAVVRTNIERLSILPCVEAHENSTEILLSRQMRGLFGALRSSRDNLVVVFDAPPLLGCDDIAALSSITDLTLVVIGEGETSRKELKLGMSNLGDESKIAGIVLNKSSQKIFKRYYY